MGFETWYQAIPDGCRLLERAKSDPVFGEFLTFPSRFRTGENCVEPHWQGADVEFCQELARLVRAHPGLETRNYTLDRYFDKIEYLISTERRNPDSKQTDLGGQAVNGALVLAEHLDGGQGHLLRYNPPDTVIAIAHLLSMLSHEDLRDNYDPVKMQAASVYKFWADRADEQQWQWICQFFDGFRSFYQSAAEHNESVIVTVT